MLLLFALPSLGTLLIYILVIGIALAVAYWLITTLFPEPFRRWAIAVVVVLGAVFLIYLLLGLAGGGEIRP